jgi:hypothetical protein
LKTRERRRPGKKFDEGRNSDDSRERIVKRAAVPQTTVNSIHLEIPDVSVVEVFKKCQPSL